MRTKGITEVFLFHWKQMQCVSNINEDFMTTNCKDFSFLLDFSSILGTSSTTVGSSLSTPRFNLREGSKDFSFLLDFSSILRTSSTTVGSSLSTPRESVGTSNLLQNVYNT